MADLLRNDWSIIFGTSGRNQSEQVDDFIGIGNYSGTLIFFDLTSY